MIRILLVHPDEKLASIYKRRLQPACLVDSVYDGRSAFRLLNQNQPNLIMSEYDLPGISGTDLLRYVRLHPVMSTTPFIFLSNREPVDEVMGLGATEWIYGPSMNPNEVIARAVYHMRLHKQQITHGI